MIRIGVVERLSDPGALRLRKAELVVTAPGAPKRFLGARCVAFEPAGVVVDVAESREGRAAGAVTVFAGAVDGVCPLLSRLKGRVALVVVPAGGGKAPRLVDLVGKLRAIGRVVDVVEFAPGACLELGWAFEGRAVASWVPPLGTARAFLGDDPILAPEPVVESAPPEAPEALVGAPGSEPVSAPAPKKRRPVAAPAPDDAA